MDIKQQSRNKKRHESVIKCDLNTETFHMIEWRIIACDFTKCMFSTVIIDAVDIFGSAKTHLIVMLSRNMKNVYEKEWNYDF